MKLIQAAVVSIAILSASAHAETAGSDVVKKVCATCHASGMMGAPKIGDKKAWEPRIAQGDATLVDHALKGIRKMPAKGGKSTLSDGEVKAAVEYMVSQSK